MALMMLGAIYRAFATFMVFALIGIYLWVIFKIVQMTWKFALLGAMSMCLLLVIAALL